jgi:hypothetical protein
MSLINDKINQIKSMYANVMSLLASNRQKLLALQPKLRTQAQLAAFQKLVSAQKNHEDIFRSKIQPTMNTLKKALAVSQQVIAKVKQAGAAVQKKFVSTAKGAWDWIRHGVGLKGLKEIKDDDNLGIAPIIAAGAIIAALTAALGYLLALAQSQQKSIDSLNDQLDQYIQAQQDAQDQADSGDDTGDGSDNSDQSSDEAA